MKRHVPDVAPLTCDGVSPVIKSTSRFPKGTAICYVNLQNDLSTRCCLDHRIKIIRWERIKKHQCLTLASWKIKFKWTAALLKKSHRRATKVYRPTARSWHWVHCVSKSQKQRTHSASKNHKSSDCTAPVNHKSSERTVLVNHKDVEGNWVYMYICQQWSSSFPV